MHRSSESIGTIAAALAKAQAELTNPDKSLVATIRSPLHREGDRTFRYAPLSSGLDIVRKGLGRYEIATIQTTAIDKDAGLLRLTTVLAHSSGEWISSEWPVCPIADIASAQRMGAALTYARRYALFTLVGIAGEDDLDAPDLCDGSLSPSAPAVDRFKPREGRVSPRTPGNADARDDKRRPPVILDADQSAALREKLRAEMGDIASADLAAAWAREALIAKNSLTATDAKLLEDAFEQRLSELASSESAGSSSDAAEHPISVTGPQVVATETRDPPAIDGIDKSILAVAAPRRYRNREHLRHVAQQACLVCGRKPSDPHHLGFTQPRALGRKVSDEFAVPLCRGHHRAVHRSRDERAWWRQASIDPIKVARRLWKATRGMGQRRSPRPTLPRPHAAAASSDPKNEDISATATRQEEIRPPHAPG
jgi:ERF superfamily